MAISWIVRFFGYSCEDPPKSLELIYESALYMVINYLPVKPIVTATRFTGLPISLWRLTSSIKLSHSPG